MQQTYGSRSARAGIAAVVAAAVVHGMIHTYSVFLSPLNEEIRLYFGADSISAITAFKTTYLLVYAASNLFFGFLTNKISARKTLAFGMGVNALAIAAFALIPPGALWPMHAVWFTAALGGGVYHPVANVLITRLYPQRKGWALGITGVGAAVGFATGPLIAEGLGWLFGLSWQGVAALFGAAGLVVAIAAGAVLRDIPQGNAATAAQAAGGTAAETAGERRRSGPGGAFWLFLAAMVLIAGTRELSMWSVLDLSDFYVHTLGAGAPRTGLLIFLIYIPGIVIAPLAGTLSDKLGRTAVATLSLLLYAAGIIVTGLVAAPLLPLSYLILGMGQAAAIPTIEAIVADASSERHRGVAFGVYLTAGIALGASGPALSGWLVDAMGASLFSFRLCLVALGSVALLGAVLLPAVLKMRGSGIAAPALFPHGGRPVARHSSEP